MGSTRLFVKNYLRSYRTYAPLWLIVAVGIAVPVLWLGFLAGKQECLERFTIDRVLGAETVVLSANEKGLSRHLVEDLDASWKDAFGNAYSGFHEYSAAGIDPPFVCAYYNPAKPGMNIRLLVSNEVPEGKIMFSNGYEYAGLFDGTKTVTLLYDYSTSVTLDRMKATIPVVDPHETIGIISRADAKKLGVPYYAMAMVPMIDLGRDSTAGTSITPREYRRLIDSIERLTAILDPFEGVSATTIDKVYVYSPHGTRGIRLRFYVDQSIDSLYYDLDTMMDWIYVPLLGISMVLICSATLVFVLEQGRKRKDLLLYASLGIRRPALALLVSCETAATFAIGTLLGLVVVGLGASVISHTPVAEELIMRQYGIWLTEIIGMNGRYTFTFLPWALSGAMLFWAVAFALLHLIPKLHSLRRLI